MKVPQLIYGSSGDGRIRGYQLLGRSSGISEEVARNFSRWAPSHGSLQSSSVDASSLSFFPVSADTWAIARSVYGGPEYSGRGGRQVVTLAILLHRSQLATYRNHPIDVADAALALGHLILPAAIRRLLPDISLPRIPFDTKANEVGLPIESIRDLAHQIENRKPTSYVVRDDEPTKVLDQALVHVSPNNRLASFTTGLKPSAHRDVQIQFLESRRPA